jgi:transcriptional regulator with XRE-family HTH domain
VNTVQRIFQLLQENGVKQKELADYLGVNESAIANWKTGKIKSYNKYLPQIATFFNIAITDLVDAPEDAIAAVLYKKMEENNVLNDNSFKSHCDNTNFYVNSKNEVMPRPTETYVPLPPSIQTVYDGLSERSKLQVQMFILDQAEKENI